MPVQQNMVRASAQIMVPVWQTMVHVLLLNNAFAGECSSRVPMGRPIGSLLCMHVKSQTLLVSGSKPVPESNVFSKGQTCA